MTTQLARAAGSVGVLLASAFSAAVFCASCNTSTSVVACTPGSAQLCACTNGATGSQICSADGAFASCVCDGADSGTPAADSGVDATTPGVDAASDIDAGSATCPAPFVTCGGTCVDPTTDPAYCGASGDCTGGNAGANCGGTWCSTGRCVYDDCSHALTAGNTSDGIYLVDVDGSGALAPMDAFCDMTTAGGGWMLVYKVGNTVPDIADPWYGMVALGSGAALPTTTAALPAGTYFEGPDRSTRWAAVGRLDPRAGILEWRATLTSSTGAPMFDVAGFGTFTTAIGMIATGWPGAPSTFVGGTGDMWVIGSSGTLPATGTNGDDFGTMPDASGRDFEGFRTTDGSATVPLIGDSSIAMQFGAQYANTTALIWTRPNNSGTRP